MLSRLLSTSIYYCMVYRTSTKTNEIFLFAYSTFFTFFVITITKKEGKSGLYSIYRMIFWKRIKGGFSSLWSWKWIELKLKKIYLFVNLNGKLTWGQKENLIRVLYSCSLYTRISYSQLIFTLIFHNCRPKVYSRKT